MSGATQDRREVVITGPSNALTREQVARQEALRVAAGWRSAPAYKATDITSIAEVFAEFILNGVPVPAKEKEPE